MLLYTILRRARARTRVWRERVIPPDVHFLTPKQVSLMTGISIDSLKVYRRLWKQGRPKGPEPAYLSPREIRYRIDGLNYYHPYPGTWLERFQSRNDAEIPAPSATRLHVSTN